jgi:hypothetical protein
VCARDHNIFQARAESTYRALAPLLLLLLLLLLRAPSPAEARTGCRRQGTLIAALASIHALWGTRAADWVGLP